MLKLTFFNQMPFIQDRVNWPHYHGDCTLIEFPNGKTMLVDISTKFSGEFLTGEMVKMGIEKIDYFVISHLHQDHTAGFAFLNEHIPVGQIYWSGYGKNNLDAEKSPLRIAEEQGIPTHELRAGDKLDIGDVHIDILFPTKDAPEADDLEPSLHGVYLNLYSLIFRIRLGGFSALFTGDIHYETEKELVALYGDRLRSTILKIPHHGNDTSVSQELVDTVNPAAAVVMSTGCEWIVLRKFSSLCTPFYGTYCDGTIRVTTDGREMTVSCDKGTRIFPLNS